MKISIGAKRRTIIGKKKDANRSGIGIKIIGIACSLSTVGNKTSSCALLVTVLNAMVMIGMIDLIGSIRMMIGDLMGRLGKEFQFMIGWGAGLVYTIDLGIVSGIFSEIKKSLKKWPMHGFPMNSYFIEMLILNEWSQGKIIVHR